MTNKETLRKQIIYRSTHRGSKEMDLLLGNFVKQNINSFNYYELVELSKFLEMEDEILKRLYFDKNDKKFETVKKVSEMFKKFKLD